MKGLFIWLLWGVLIAGVCVAADQLLLHSSVDSPTLAAAQTFYRDFRVRIIHLVKKDEHRLEALIPESPTLRRPAGPAETSKSLPVLTPKPGGYVYSDKDGGLHLTTRLDEVPKEYRARARPLQK